MILDLAQMFVLVLSQTVLLKLNRRAQPQRQLGTSRGTVDQGGFRPFQTFQGLVRC